MPELAFRGRKVTSDRAFIMAIVNRTPDSFYDHGATFDEDRAKAAISAAVAEGADVLDIGGIPASPGPEVTVEEELRRVLPTLEWTREQFPDLVISIDTYRHEVADVVCQAGADLLNDTWQGHDPEVLEVAAKYGAGYVCSHTGGLEPRTDPTRPQYDDVVADVVEETTALAERAVALGVPREGVLIDPTIDFGKNTYQSLEVLGRLSELVDTGWPVLMAMSNKNVVGETLDVELDDRVTGTLAATALAAQAGAVMFRAHQVRETRHTLEMVASIGGLRKPSRVVRYLD
ncbi:dihydropteroate synthase [Saccharopolyspora rhizosphaerae]|uniref:Dihydropteroate synthase n=1 Tax=Saccharopolyspora rhizosphaerae TaxID=2492662 RepID=A0A3R8NZE2_9PSEU|nr:dihydropteroate synthase [Saccharopolyspora rhizosphaerae]RRO13150.1 dihydropteroate synthase [Saccharopolyspora rhizosphaerae]